MTNNGIKTRDILMALHQDNFEWVNKNEFVRITYRDFARACHQIDIADPRTIRCKWEILQDKDILRSANKYNAIVDLQEFYKALGKEYLAAYKKRTQTDIHTKTLTQCDTGGSA